MSLSGGAIAGIVTGSILGLVFIVVLIWFLVRRALRGPTKGSDNPKRLDSRVVVITGTDYHKYKLRITILILVLWFQVPTPA